MQLSFTDLRYTYLNNPSIEDLNLSKFCCANFSSIISTKMDGSALLAWAEKLNNTFNLSINGNLKTDYYYRKIMVGPRLTCWNNLIAFFYRTLYFSLK